MSPGIGKNAEMVFRAGYVLMGVYSMKEKRASAEIGKIRMDS
jgi:hypothetical protein